jgi:CubicO group peptidase (beta-lactamase class C family)
VRQLLGHTSAQQEPWWEPAAGYHGFTQGHLVGEVVRRVTGKPLGTFLTDEVTTPLGVAQDYIGTPEEADPQVPLLIPGFPIHPRVNRFFARALLNPPATPRDSWTIPWRRTCMGALNGHSNARGIATAQSVLASGGVGGVRLISDAGRHPVLEHETAGLDLVLDIPLRWGMGYSDPHSAVAVTAAAGQPATIGTIATARTFSVWPMRVWR